MTAFGIARTRPGFYDPIPTMSEPTRSPEVSATAPTSPAAEAKASDAQTLMGDYWRWCPRCGMELENRGCKLRCERCHYFMSCSDFD